MMHAGYEILHGMADSLVSISAFWEAADMPMESYELKVQKH